jgi:hypothetical protein
MGNRLNDGKNTTKSICDTYVVAIRNMNLPKTPRVFDVTVNGRGEILRYDIQNIKGNIFIEDIEVKQQIHDALTQK